MVWPTRRDRLPQLFYIKTFGCQMNKHDSDSISQILMNEGYQQSKNVGDADIVLVNTCAVREKAEKKALTVLGRLASLKQKKEDLITGVIGCVAQEQGIDLLKRFPHLDLILGPRNIHHIDRFIARIKKRRERISSLDLSGQITSLPKYSSSLKGRVTCFLKIMEGCDNFCSYCIVPFVRGRETSLSAQEVIDEANRLVRQGIKEITLIGQNVNSYNMSNGSGPTFTGLLKSLDSILGLKRLRFTTSHPKDISDDLISLFGELRTLSPHIHLPVQSGSDTILELMNRGYTTDTYISLIERLRKVRTDIAITTDMIVGFPGEGRRDFEDSLRLIEEVKFDNIFSFKYSERSGTRATCLPGKIEDPEKQKRLFLLQQRQKEITLGKNKSLEGTVQEVLVEGPGKRGSHQLSGRTPGNKVVNFFSTTDLKGELVLLKIIEGCQNSLLGEIVGIGNQKTS
jgi:tRNA-2-methylthio-N6-dimethylallyladenosine synthase